MFVSSKLSQRFFAACCSSVAMVVAGSAAHAAPLKPLYAFQGDSDGIGPSHGVIADKQGNLYGATAGGGGGSSCGKGLGCGTIYKITPDGKETVLYAFQGGQDGYGAAYLIVDDTGTLYGTTYHGGTYHLGTAFMLSPTGTKTTLYSFRGDPDGAFPEAALVKDRNGNLFGTTILGGSHGKGTVFRIAAGGAETVLYTFCSKDNCADGQAPQSPLTLGSDGSLYGTTDYGGISGGGTVFKLARNGKESVLYSFCQQNNCADGQSPESGATIDKAGNLYGTTNLGGANNVGTVWKLSADGTETVLHSMDPDTDGGNPVAGVIVERSGDIYGTVTTTAACPDGSPAFRLYPNGSEKIYCGYGGQFGGLLERNGYLFGAALPSGKYPGGLVYSLKK